MAVSGCRIVRAAGKFLLGLVALLSIPASAAVRSTAEVSAPAAATSFRASISLRATVAKPDFRPDASRGLPTQLLPPVNSVGHRFTRRIFVEGTTFPSGDALTAAWLQVPLRPQTRAQPAPPVHRNTFASPSSRQRAP